MKTQKIFVIGFMLITLLFSQISGAVSYGKVFSSLIDAHCSMQSSMQKLSQTTMHTTVNKVLHEHSTPQGVECCDHESLNLCGHETCDCTAVSFGIAALFSTLVKNDIPFLSESFKDIHLHLFSVYSARLIRPPIS